MTSTKQIQQFIDLVNYMADFVPYIASRISCLSQLLKKYALPWEQKHTTIVQKLKQCSTKLPPLQIPSIGHKILQTDASNTQWGAVLYKELEGKRHPCGCKSGTFLLTKQNYYSTFKEILAIKSTIEKF